MCLSRVMCLSLLVAAVSVPSAAEAEQQSDIVTEALFEQYIARGGKINSESVSAAILLVAERGRTTGFWRAVLAELQRNRSHSEIGCLRVLGKMLETDAAARDALRRQKEFGEISAWIPSVHVGQEVLTELIARAEQADRNMIDHYTVALARARMPETREFFRSILESVRKPSDPFRTSPNSFYHLDSTRFHAAAGLAQLGDAKGMEWLIQHTEPSAGTVMNGWPVGTPRGGNLSDCCGEALRHLSGERQLTTQAEWAAWWTAKREKFVPERAIVWDVP